MANKPNVRESALYLLDKIENNQSYSNLLLNQVISKHEIDPRDIGLLTELTYGTLQRKLTLDYYLKPFIKGKLENWVLQLLRLTLYQMLYLDKIPDRAAIFEAVEIAKKKGHKGIASLVNGILRNVQRKGVPSLDAIENENERLSIETSHPLWLVDKWVSQLGYEETKRMCELNLEAPIQTARVNTTKVSVPDVLKLLEEEGYIVEPTKVVPEGIACLKGNIAHSVAFQNGLLTVQDESSMLVGYALGARSNERILDACAAPGGKTTHIGEMMSNSGEIISLDLHEHKVKLIKNNARRLGLNNIDARAMDSRDASSHFERESFDRILLDAPCSGLGVMRRKPDMKYTKNENDGNRLHDIQYALLQSVAPLLKKGGTMVYSTCTIDDAENNAVVNTFLKEYPDFEGDREFINRMPKVARSWIDSYSMQILPQYFNSDGFYIAALRKKV